MIHETETVVYHNSNREKFKGLKIKYVVGEEIICKALPNSHVFTVLSSYAL